MKILIVLLGIATLAIVTLLQNSSRLSQKIGTRNPTPRPNYKVQLAYDYHNWLEPINVSGWATSHHRSPDKSQKGLTYDFSVDLPPGWKMIDRETPEGGFPVVLLTKTEGSVKSPSEHFQTIPQITIGMTEFFSTSGALCGNGACHGVGELSVSLGGEKITLELVKRVNDFFDEERPQEVFYVFIISEFKELQGPWLKGTTGNPPVTVWFNKLSDLDEILEILSSIRS